MAGIRLADGERWMVSRAAYRRLLERTEAFVDEDILIQELREGVANEMLFLDIVEPYVARGIAEALARAAKAELEEEPAEGRVRDEWTTTYHAALRDLAGRLESL